MVDELTGRGRVERVYREQGARMVRTVFAYARDMEIAEDAVAEAFAQVIRRGDDVRDIAAWVWRSSFRIANGELAERRSRSSAAVREGRYEMGVDAAEVFDAVGMLSPKQRAAILLHHYVDLPVRDVADAIGSTPAAVRVHLSVGRRRLRALLEDDDD